MVVEFEAVLPFAATRELERMAVTVTTVPAKSVSSLVKLAHSLRQPELAHLKRVHKRNGVISVEVQQR